MNRRNAAYVLYFAGAAIVLGSWLGVVSTGIGWAGWVVGMIGWIIWPRARR